MRAFGGLVAILAFALLVSVLPMAGWAAEPVSIPRLAPESGPAALSGHLFRPEGPGSFPAIVALHGCNGLMTRDGHIAAREQDWAEYLAGLGYAVLLLDSFTARGVREICSQRHRAVNNHDRVADAEDALAWLGNQPGIDRSRIALLGWSHGGGTVLDAVPHQSSRRRAASDIDFRAAIAFYPGCGNVLRRDDYRVRMPLLILVGKADDWTPAPPCAELADRLAGHGTGQDPAVRAILYPGAHHAFDMPNSPVHQRTGIAVRGGGDRATLGTDPAARADSRDQVTAWLAQHLSGRAHPLRQ
ncbi:MAG: dienelactone hydrolase family protein [Alphaproteobacteria bacterium]